jgi:uncharacterized protein DUF6065
MLKVPDRHLVVICEHQRYEKSVDLIIRSLKGQKLRDWFNKHAYFCLPLVIGNQYGFAIRSLKAFSAIWNGKNSPEDTKVKITDHGENPDYQTISSHFGMGVVTIQNRFTLRTPSGVNLMTINPPNHWIDGIQHMTGVVETDNLRRDFTFNLKVTRPNYEVHVKKGEFIGCVIPIPRYFVDSFCLSKGEELFEKGKIQEERKIMQDFGKERSTVDKEKPRRNGRRYFMGEDVYGNSFPDHQTKLI